MISVEKIITVFKHDDKKIVCHSCKIIMCYKCFQNCEKCSEIVCLDCSCNINENDGIVCKKCPDVKNIRMSKKKKTI